MEPVHLSIRVSLQYRRIGSDDGDIVQHAKSGIRGDPVLLVPLSSVPKAEVAPEKVFNFSPPTHISLHTRLQITCRCCLYMRRESGRPIQTTKSRSLFFSSLARVCGVLWLDRARELAMDLVTKTNPARLVLCNPASFSGNPAAFEERRSR